MDLLAYLTSHIFFPVRLIRVLRLIICVLLFFFNNLIFLVKIRLLWVCLVMENLNERRKEIERKKMEGNNR